MSRTPFSWNALSQLPAPQPKSTTEPTAIDRSRIGTTTRAERSEPSPMASWSDAPYGVAGLLMRASAGAPWNHDALMFSCRRCQFQAVWQIVFGSEKRGSQPNTPLASDVSATNRSEERRVGKEC